MRPKTPPFQPNETKEEREQKLRDFILTAADISAARRDDAIQVLARSPDSPVMRALLSVSGELAARGAGASIILAGGAIAAEDETWSLVFSANFVHEIRLTSNPRVLDAHEQIVIGTRAAWYGDSMRRDPWKRDAFAMFQPDDRAAAERSRTTFERLWNGAQSIYASPAVDAVVATAGPATPQPGAGRTPALEGGPRERDADAVPPPGEEAVCAAFETLEAWRPSTRH